MDNFIEALKPFMISGKHAHLIGIGGVSMRPLALVLASNGLIVSGSDMNAAVVSGDLNAAGIRVFIGHQSENIEGADCIIRTAAVHNDNPEIQAARAKGIPVFERAQVWGYLMRNYRHAVCVSGTHGKTTTTSMITQITMSAGLDPTVMIGGYFPYLGANHRIGCGDMIIAESCEYCNSFLNFFPTLAIINNIEEDHLDFFKDIEDIKASFRKFASLVPENGRILANGDDVNTLSALEGLKYTTFGFGENCFYRAVNHSEDFREFDILKNGSFFTHISLSVYGRHNSYNATGAVAAADICGISPETISKSLSAFTGAGRRMEKKGTYNGADVYDDYAHHPSEVHAVLSGARLMGYKRIICAFQPHTYSRTASLFDDFVKVLKEPDIIVLAEIYAARESNTIGISSKDLCDRVPGSFYCATLPAVTEKLKLLAQPGDLIVTIGAGDIFKAGEQLVKASE